MTSSSRVFALIPAAGKSRRMGRSKLDLPLGGRTILERVIAALRAGGATEVLVVLGPHVADLQPTAQQAGARTLILPHETPDMRATIQHGLTWLEENRTPGPTDGVLLAPADHPTLDPEVVRTLLSAAADAEATVFVPTWQGRRGHPVLLGWSHIAAIRGLPPGEGINAYLRGQTEVTLEVPLGTAEILRDLDTPEDYQRLVR